MNEVEEIKDKIDIVDLIGGYLTLKKAGVNYKGLCPFHNEKTPSFMVSAERQTFKCFGCGKGGDAFTFIEEIEGMDFYDSLKLLAGKVGVELKHKENLTYSGKTIAPTEKSRIFEINELASKLYHKILTDHPKAEHARKYLKNRGIDEKTIENWNLGYAPRSWDLLIKFISVKGFNEKEIFKAGLLVLGEKGRYWDRFRGRIMFPIYNISGQVVAFTGRILEDDPKAAKYVNSAESPIYTKGKTIYGLDRARIDIRSQGKSIMVEGQMDVIAAHEAGFHNVVAVSGTALTMDQLAILARYSPDIIFAFDSDTAGKTALKRAITLSLQNDINAKVLTLTGFKDPDEAIKSDPKNFEIAVKNAKPGLQWWIDGLILELGDDVSAKKKISKEILPVIKIASNEIEKEYYIKYLAKKLALSEQTITEQLGKTKSNSAQQKDYSEQKIADLSSEQKLAGLLWHQPKLSARIPQGLNPEFQDQTTSELFLAIRKNLDIKNLPVDLKNKLDLYDISATKDLDFQEEMILEREFDALIRDFTDKRKEKIKDDYAKKIAEAESDGNREKLKILMKELQSAIMKEK